jgi:hypothetical protein
MWNTPLEEVRITAVYEGSGVDVFFSSFLGETGSTGQVTGDAIDGQLVTWEHSNCAARVLGMS